MFENLYCMRKLFLAAFALILCIFATAQKKPSSKPNVSDRFDAYIQNALQLWKTPGLSIAVVKDNQVIFKKGYGVKELGKPDAFNTATIAICASTTKAMTAVCMGMLVDEGKLNWDDKVTEIYPDVRFYDNYINSEVTIKDLFTHNAGLGNADLLWVLDYGMDTIMHRIRYLKPEYTYHSSFIYQNIMYMLAGEVIHKISGKPWDEFIAERLFKPLGMTNTYATYRQSLGYDNRITPHFMYEDSVIKPIPTIISKTVDAAGGVWSCADDITKWMRFMLDGAKLNGERLLQPQTYEALFTPQTLVPPSEFYPTQKFTKPHWMSYGLGWFQHDYKGRMVQFHTGSLDGAVAIIGLIPDANFGVYVFGNMDHTELRHALMYKAMDMWVFNSDTTDWSRDLYGLYTGIAAQGDSAQRSFEAQRIPGTKPSAALNAYTGIYSNQTYGAASVIQLNDSLLLQFPNHFNLFLSHWHYDTFLAKYEREWYGKDYVRFNLNASGKVSGFSFAGIEYEKKE